MQTCRHAERADNHAEMQKRANQLAVSFVHFRISAFNYAVIGVCPPAGRHADMQKCMLRLCIITCTQSVSKLTHQLSNYIAHN